MQTFNFPTEIRFALPHWAPSELIKWPEAVSDVKEQMKLVINLSWLNVKHKTGGPFGAAVFDEQGKLLGAGVNTVVPSHCSLLHAENMALCLAQAGMKTFDLGAKENLSCRLVTSSQPCVQCFGAIHWSGIKELVIGANGEDVEALAGFDEGPLNSNWRQELLKRGVFVTEGVLRKEACTVLRQYRKNGGIIYNGGRENNICYLNTA